MCSLELSQEAIELVGLLYRLVEDLNRLESHYRTFVASERSRDGPKDTEQPCRKRDQN